MKALVRKAISYAKDLGYEVAHDGQSNYFNFSDGFAIGYFETRDPNRFSIMLEVKQSHRGMKIPFISNARFDSLQLPQLLDNTMTFNPCDYGEIVYWNSYIEFMEEHWNPDWKTL